MENPITSPPAPSRIPLLGVGVEDVALVPGVVGDTDPSESAVALARAPEVAVKMLPTEAIASEDAIAEVVVGAPDPDVGADTFPDKPSEVEEAGADEVEGSMKLAVVTGKVNTESEVRAAPVPFGSFGLTIVKMPPWFVGLFTAPG